MPSVRILVADDDPTLRLILRYVLADWGYQVVGEARSATSAVDLARELQPDLVIMDAWIPLDDEEMNGFEVAELVIREDIAAVLLLSVGEDLQPALPWSLDDTPERLRYGWLGGTRLSDEAFQLRGPAHRYRNDPQLPCPAPAEG